MAAADGLDEAQRSKTRPYSAADASAVTPRSGESASHPATTDRIMLVHRPARPAPLGAGRQAEASRRGVATGPRGCQAVPRAGAERPKARHDFVFSQVFSP